MNFRYYAIGKTGKPEHGHIEADGEATAKNEVRNKVLFSLCVAVSLSETR